MSGPGRQRTEIELTPKAEEYPETIWDNSFRQFGVAQAVEYICRLAATFDVLATHEIGTQRPELREDIYSQPVEQHMIYFIYHHILQSRSYVFSVSLRIGHGMSPGDNPQAKSSHH